MFCLNRLFRIAIATIAGAVLIGAEVGEHAQLVHHGCSRRGAGQHLIARPEIRNVTERAQRFLRLAALDGLRRTVLVSGFSKILAPQWRVGFVAAPAAQGAKA